VQASHAWTPPGGTLGQILDSTRRRLLSLDRDAAGAGRPAGAVPPPSLKARLQRRTVGVIAEIKRKSPSRGVLNAGLDAPTQARAFEAGGAVGVSVLTEPHYFGGRIGDIQDVGDAVSLPLLRKDFHIDPIQLSEARDAGASAVLLIVRALDHELLAALLAWSRKLGLEALVEVRTESELETALKVGADMIGVNSRDLETLEVDERVPRRLMPLLPANVVGVWESGVHTRDDVRRAAECGADAVLVGSALSKAPDPAALVRSLASIERQPRRG
jgi:indole-3-glycerol phosphate synthase